MEIAMSPTGAESQLPGDSGRWFVGFTKPRQEARAAENLRHQGFDCQLPVIRIPRRIGGDVLWQAEAMFPRYLFLRPALGAAPLGRVRSTFGMNGLVRFAGLPATVADAVVEQLVAFGETHRETLFAAGESLRFVQGPLVGMESVFERAEGEARAIVLLEFLQREVRVTVPARMLARVR